MYEKKESTWKKKGFYLSVCTAMICLLAIGTVYYKMNYDKGNNGGNLFAENQTEEQKDKSDVKKDSEIEKKLSKEKKEKNTSDSKETKVASVNDKSDVKNNAGKNKDDIENSEKSDTKHDKSKDDKKDSKNDNTDSKNANKEDNTVTVMSGVNKHTFNEEKGLIWPVNGDVILKYSMNNTVYFKTLAQYKCNPAIAIAAKKGTSVKSAADGTVIKVGKDSEIGKYVTVDIGSNYTVKYGQLDNITVKNGQEVKEGELLGKIAKPTKYYVEEGSNLYLQVKQNGNTVDPLLVLR